MIRQHNSMNTMHTYPDTNVVSGYVFYCYVYDVFCDLKAATTNQLKWKLCDFLTQGSGFESLQTGVSGYASTPY